jgi:AraC-like DNA-binding protein
MPLIERYNNIGMPIVALQFNETKGRASWTVDPLPHPGIDRSLYQFMVEMQLGVLVSLHREIMGAAFNPAELHVTFVEQDAARRATEALGCPCQAGQKKNQLLFDASWLDRPSRCGNDAVHASLLALCEKQCEEIRRKIGVAGKVFDSLLATGDRNVAFDDVACRLGFPARTLRRKLSQQNTSFRELMDQLQTHAAIQYLRDTQMTIEDIANSLGFSDTANFRRAFHRWTKASPQNFRRTIRS